MISDTLAIARARSRSMPGMSAHDITNLLIAPWRANDNERPLELNVAGTLVAIACRRRKRRTW